MSTPVKVAIVTGAGTGVGKRTALALLEVGYSVALAGRRVEPLESTVAAAGPAASRALVVPTDVGGPDAFEMVDLFELMNRASTEGRGPVAIFRRLRR